MPAWNRPLPSREAPRNITILPREVHVYFSVAPFHSARPSLNIPTHALPVRRGPRSILPLLAVHNILPSRNVHLHPAIDRNHIRFRIFLHLPSQILPRTPLRQRRRLILPCLFIIH